MAETCRDIKISLREYRDIITRHVRCNQILPHMCFSDDALLAENIRSLERENRQREGLGLFLDYMENTANHDDYALLLKVLKEQGYTNVVKLLNGDDSLDPMMSKTCCRLIQFFSQYMERKIDLMCPRLIAEEFMDAEDRDHLWTILEMMGSKMAALWLVLTILPRRKENWSKQFLMLLEEHGYHDLVIWIADTVIAADSDEDQDDWDEGGEERNMLSANGEEENRDVVVEESKMYLMNIQLADPDDISEVASEEDNAMYDTDADYPDDISEENNAMYDADEDELFQFREKQNIPLDSRQSQEELPRAQGRGPEDIPLVRCGNTEFALNVIQDDGNNGESIGYLVQYVDKDLIIRHVRVGPIIGLMAHPAEFQVTVHKIIASEYAGDVLQATKHFLDYLVARGEPRDYLLLAQLIEQADYDYLTKLLRGEPAMDPETHKEHCSLVEFFSNDISDKVHFDVIARKLIEDSWMDITEQERLECLANRQGNEAAMKWMVYYVLPKRKENWLKQFLQILNYKGLAAWISGETDGHASAAIDSDTANREQDNVENIMDEVVERDITRD